MTCKDCVHCEACKMILRSAYPDVTEAEIIQAENNQTKCVNFKDKTRFVELPCGIGKIAYVAFNGKVLKSVIVSITAETDGEQYIFILKLKIYDKIFQFKKFILGKDVFLTREEAEKALKECGENG